MTLQETLKTFGYELATIEGVTVRHYTRGKAAPPFLVWQEEAEGTTFHANNGRCEPRIAGTLDYFTKTEYDPKIDEIQQLLENCCIWNLESVQYEEETGMIHYAWNWELGYG